MNQTDSSILELETARSGPFTFRVGINLDNLSSLLGQAEYGHSLFMSTPMLPEISARLEKDTLVSSIYGTDTIEGGTLTEEETEILLATPEQAKDVREKRIVNLSMAYAQMEEYVAQNRKDKIVSLSETFIKQLHKTISKDLDSANYQPGLYRDNPKGQITKVGDEDHGGAYKPPQARVDIELLMKEFVQWINQAAICALPPLVRASLAHYYFERIHPFKDGNGRVGRLIEKAILVGAGYHHAARGLDMYYLEHIDEYFIAFNAARKNEGEVPQTCNQVFAEFVIRGFLETIKRLQKKVGRITATMIILTALGRLLKEKKINHRQHAIAEHLLFNLKKPTAWQIIKDDPLYKALYREYSKPTESRDWAKLVELGIVERDESNNIAIGKNYRLDY